MAFTYSSNVITQANTNSTSFTGATLDGNGNINLVVPTQTAYASGDLLEVTGSTYYDGVYELVSTTSTTLQIPLFDTELEDVTWQGTDTGTCEKGDSSSIGLHGLTGAAFDSAGKAFTFSGVKIEIAGALLIDPEFEQWIFDDDCVFPYVRRLTDSFFQIGRKKTSGSKIAYSQGSIITSKLSQNDPVSTYDVSLKGLINSASGINTRFIAMGGIINTTLPLAICGDHGNKSVSATLNIESLTINNTNYLAQFTYRLCALYFNESASNIKNLNLVVTGRTTTVELRNDSGMVDATFKLERSAINTDFQATDPKTFLNCEFANNMNAYDIRLREAGHGPDFYDTYTNNDVGASAIAETTSNNRKGQYITRQVLNIASKAVNQSNVDAKFYLEDTVGANASTSASTPQAIDFTNQFTYSDTAVSGLAELNIITSFIKKVANSSPVSHYRSNAGTSVDDYTVYGYLYGKSLLELPVTAKGTGGTTVVATFTDNQVVTELSKTTVNAYTEIDTSSKFYDRSAAYLEDNFGTYLAFILARQGTLIDAGAYNVTIDATASSAFAISGNTITIKASTFTGDMTTTGVITLSNGAAFNGTRTDANGTVLPLRNISVTGLTAGSRLRVYNETTSAQIVNAVVSGTSYTATYAEGTGYSANDVLSLRIAKIDKLETVSSVVVSVAGWTALVSQDTNTIYADHGVNGASVTGIAWDSGNMQFDFNETDNIIAGPDIGAWYQYFITTEVGIAEAFGALIWPQINKLTNVTSKAAITWDNVKSTPLQINNAWIDRDDGASIIAATSNSIQINPPAVFVKETATSGLTPAESTKLNEISDVKANTNLIPALL